MSGIGIGIGIALGAGGGAMNSASLLRRITAVLGSDLVGLKIPDNAVMSGSDVTSVTATAGADLVASGAFQRTAVNGRQLLTTADNGVKYFTCADTGIRTVVAVAQVAAVPFSGYPCLVRGTSGTEFIFEGDSGASNWRASLLGATTYENGTADGSPSAGALRIFEWSCATPNDAIVYMGNSSGTYAWVSGLCGAIVTASVQLTAGQRTAINQALAEYHRITL